MPVDACQSPPAALQSVWLVIFDRALPLEESDGLADGEEPDEEPDDGADIDPLLEPEPVAPGLPLPPLLLPEPPAPLLEPGAPEPLPVPAPVCAATSAGAKVIIPIKSRVSIFFISISPPCGSCEASALPRRN